MKAFAILAAGTLLWIAGPGCAKAPPSPGRPAVPSAREDQPAFRRFALVVGADDGGASRVKLRYAGTDAAAFADVLAELGGVAREDLEVLKQPTRKEFLSAMEILRDRIGTAAAQGARPELLVYFSGHSDETGLMFGPDRLGYSEFRKRIDSVPARIRIAIVDACASGALTRLKGGRRLPAFSVDRSSDLRGYAFLTSSSGSEAAQESDRIRASYFTHFLVTGLRGAADRNQDGKVTLGEAYEFAFQETLSQTEGTQAGAQHPGYDMRLTGTGDLVLTDLRGTSAGLVLDPGLRGRIFVRSASGSLVAELQKQTGKKVELGLEPGMYDVSLDRGDSLYRALIKVDTLVHQPVSHRDFEAVVREKTRSRGGPDSGSAMAAEADSGAVPAQAIPAPAPIGDGPGEEWIAARAALVPSIGFPGRGGPYSHNLSVNLLAGEARSIQGLQFSLFFNRASRNVEGVQLGLINSSHGRSAGVQTALLFNAKAHVHRGLQFSPIANAADSLMGVQVGGINYIGRGWGVQGGLLNTAGTHTGIQAGLMNFAGESRGLQAGLLNYAVHSEAAVLGLVNIIGNGLHDLETTLDEKSMLRTAFLLGGPYNYNYISFDMKARYPRHLWGYSAGVGMHLPRKPVFADLDMGVGMLYNEVDWDNYSVHGRVRFLAGYSPIRWFSLFGGLTYNAEAWPGSRRPNLNPERNGEHWFDDVRARRWTGFVLGVRI